jgi:hypothetical protein
MRPPQDSRVPAVVDALVGIASDMKIAGEIDNYLDGPTPKVIPMGRTLAVFVSDRAVESRTELMQGMGTAYQETFDVVCNLFSWSGGTDTKFHRDTAYAVLSDFKTRLTADQKLGGACDRAYLGSQSVATPQNDSDGCSVAIAFTVRAQATI